MTFLSLPFASSESSSAQVTTSFLAFTSYIAEHSIYVRLVESVGKARNSLLSTGVSERRGGKYASATALRCLQYLPFLPARELDERRLEEAGLLDLPETRS